MQKNNSKWMKGSNVRPETMKLLEEKTGDGLLDPCRGDEFLESPSEAKAAEADTSECDNITFKSFRAAEATTKPKGKPRSGSRYLRITHPTRRPYPNCVKDSYDSRVKTKNLT